MCLLDSRSAKGKRQVEFKCISIQVKYKNTLDEKICKSTVTTFES